MKASNIFLLLIPILFVSCSEKINTEKTKEHTLISGTTTYIIPPYDFHKAEMYKGFQHNSWMVSIAYTEVDQSLKAFEESYSQKNLSHKKWVLDEKKKILHNNNNQGLFLKILTEGLKKHEYLLAIEHEGKLKVLKTSFPKTIAQYFEEPLLTSMKSVYFADENEIGIEEKIPFTINEDFVKLAHYEENKVIYTKDGKYPTNSSDSLTFIITGPAKLPVVNGIIIKNTYGVKEFFKKNAPSLMLGANVKIESTDEIWVDTMQGEEIVAYSSSSKNKKLGYMTLLSQNSHYVLSGFCVSDFDKNLEELKKVTRSFTRK